MVSYKPNGPEEMKLFMILIAWKMDWDRRTGLIGINKLSASSVLSFYWWHHCFNCSGDFYQRRLQTALTETPRSEDNANMQWKSVSFAPLLLAFLSLNSCICQDPVCNDCCNSYKEIDEPRRSIKSVWEPGQTPLCDRLISSGWYRFTSFNGTKMPETPVLDFQCGTHDPIWLKDPHPTEQEGNVARKACISSFGEPCLDSFTINVKKCTGDYFVYYLRPLYYCAVAYCAGFQEPCPYGKEGEPPKCYDPPAKFSSQNLGLPEISYVAKSQDVSVTLVCKVAILNGIEKWKNVSYLIEWVSEEKTLKREPICGDLLPGKTNRNPCPNQNLISQLPGTSYRIGQWISCEVSAKFTTSPKNKWSSPRRVPQPFFAGLKVYPTALNLEACDTKNHIITITPTIPVRRAPVRGLPILSFRTPKEVNILEGCNLKLQEGIKEHKIKITASCGQQVSEGLKLIFPYIVYQNSRFWNKKAHLPTILVTMRAKTEIEQCSSSGDPHYSTLKPANSFGKYFDFMGRGDFILYKNTERYFEVQTRQWRCGGSVTCNCGVVVRDHNDVIEFNCCNDRMERDFTTPIFVKIRSKECLSPGISIKKLQPGVRNAKYEALFPSGPKVVVQRSSWGMNVDVYTPRAKDAAKESGLCLEPPKTQDPDTYGENLRYCIHFVMKESAGSFFSAVYLTNLFSPFGLFPPNLIQHPRCSTSKLSNCRRKRYSMAKRTLCTFFVAL